MYILFTATKKHEMMKHMWRMNFFFQKTDLLYWNKEVHFIITTFHTQYLGKMIKDDIQEKSY